MNFYLLSRILIYHYHHYFHAFLCVKILGVGLQEEFYTNLVRCFCLGLQVYKHLPFRLFYFLTSPFHTHLLSTCRSIFLIFSSVSFSFLSPSLLTHSCLHLAAGAEVWAARVADRRRLSGGALSLPSTGVTGPGLPPLAGLFSPWLILILSSRNKTLPDDTSQSITLKTSS